MTKEDFIEEHLDEPQDDMDYFDIKIKSLELAIKAATVSEYPENILKMAKDFYKFIIEEDEETGSEGD